MRKLTTTEFVRLASSIHDGKYDYSKTEYINGKSNVSIICPNHGIFEQRASHHLDGRGCKKCSTQTQSKKQRKSNTDFIEQAIQTHGDVYDYSLVEYINARTTVRIICPIHGAFDQLPNGHIVGQGCPVCAGNASKNTEKFIQDARQIHGSTYDYSQSVYVNAKTKLKIVCPAHGVFEQKPTTHLHDKCGCPSCCKTKKSSLNEFIIKAKSIHGNLYDYSCSIYVNARTKLKIICHIHGEFEQTPDNHISDENGCPLCCHKRVSKKETKWLNHLGIDSSYRQFTLTINGKSYSVDGFDPLTNTVYEFYGDFWHGNPAIYNQDMINKKSKRPFGELYERTIQKERLIKEAGYLHISIWETDFDKLCL